MANSLNVWVTTDQISPLLWYATKIDLDRWVATDHCSPVLDTPVTAMFQAAWAEGVNQYIGMGLR